ncbi:MAG: hypothetical protein HOC20_01325 [Chloroflexi bacterium]|jgi:thymidylate synthase|nr:hypothetical protein [Chloroflexota bacterium]
MRVLIIEQGPYGERIARNIKQRSPQKWTVESFKLTMALPPLIEEPEDFLPPELPPSDLVVFLSETEQAPQLIPDIVDLTGASGVIAPIDNSQWVPMGLKNQIQKELTQKGIGSVFPKTFCTLTENSCGYRHAAESYENDVIAAFAECFGRPKFNVTVNPESKIIEAVEVERGAPCGSSHHTATGLVGMHVDDALPKAGLICHHFPCQASMQQEQIDKMLYDTLMHLSGYVVNEDIEEQIKPFRTPTRYMTQ